MVQKLWHKCKKRKKHYTNNKFLQNWKKKQKGKYLCFVSWLLNHLRYRPVLHPKMTVWTSGLWNNVWLKKTWTNCSSVSLLWFVQVFLNQTLYSCSWRKNWLERVGKRSFISRKRLSHSYLLLNASFVSCLFWISSLTNSWLFNFSMLYHNNQFFLICTFYYNFGNNNSQDLNQGPKNLP